LTAPEKMSDSGLIEPILF